MTEHVIENIDHVDPEISSDATRAYMNIQKTEIAIQRLEKKVEEDRNRIDGTEDYEQDKMLLDNMRNEMKDEAA